MGVRTELPEWLEQNTILQTTVGSESHGIILPESPYDDHDEMAVFIEPPANILGMGVYDTYMYRTAWSRTGSTVSTPEQPRSIKGDTDYVAYGLKKYISLLAKGNPSLIVPLFTPQKLIILETIYGIKLKESLRPLVKNKTTGKAFLGYALSQREALEGKRGSKVKRPELVEQFGYDSKFAYHLIRLCIQGLELLNTGTITLPVSDENKKILLDIRRGIPELEHVIQMSLELEEQLKTLIKSDELPNNINTEDISTFLSNMYISFWKDNKLL